MITTTMTWSEIRHEIQSDIRESNIHRRVYAQIEYKMNKYKRAIKEERYYFFRPIVIKSNRHNTYYCMPFTLGKSSFKRDLIKYNIGTFIDTPTGHYLVMSTETGIIAYTYHLIERYYERFDGMEYDDDFKTCALKFATRNDSCVNVNNLNTKYGENAVFSVCADGVMLGHCIDNIRIQRTYISYDMLKGNQIGVSEEMIPELIQDIEELRERQHIQAQNYKRYRRLIA